MKNTDFRDAFLQRLPADQILALFDRLPDVSFFVKDRRGRFVSLNRRGCEYCGVTSADDVIGKTDHDFFPKVRADEYRDDDRRVMKSGKPIINRIESAPEDVGSPRLVATTKIPLRDQSGKVIGVAGCSRQIERMQSGTADALGDVMEYLHQHFDRHVTSDQLAEMSGLSVSHFERRFRLAFGTSPRQYLIRIRIEQATKMLRQTDHSVSNIAQRCGFYDHAHFSRSFQRIMNVSPTKYRRQYGENAVVPKGE
ncbi:AraC family transcriptional regulator [Crateriforma conspicua]|uniref:HTH-type transcriptional activator RhaS n=1 Tax=Crateriforma conspicua TaxID=2527996 RepID=A0A5C5XYP2_9PLAN|nr:AraC family transcriptional regulator [Crateriforma conspicua]QDV62694.1 HTH-type transcriptional activator RhaS [Crateriforma conspicua]TWT68536.1 HTH-type transcriptional activator RhaS [Crateriforma conspicua]